MNELKDETRRNAIKWMAGVGAWVLAAASVQAKGPEKLSKAEVGYVERGAEGMECDDCMHFVPGKKHGAPGSCRIVAGAVSPHGYCRAFAEKRG